MDYVEPEDRGVIWVWVWLIAGMAALVLAVGVYKQTMAVAAEDYVPGLYRAGAVGEPTICYRSLEVQDWIIKQLGISNCADIGDRQLERMRGAFGADFPLLGGDLAGMPNLDSLTIETSCRWWAEDERYAWDVLERMNPAARVTIHYQPAAAADAKEAVLAVALNLAHAGFGDGDKRAVLAESGRAQVGNSVRVLAVAATAADLPGCPQRRF